MRQRRIRKVWKELDGVMEITLILICTLFGVVILLATLPIWVVPYLAYRIIKYLRKRPSRSYWG